jgi:preprotein translocase subunit YajC
MDPLLIILLLGAGAMFLLSNRSRKQQRQAQEFRAHLKPGDEVMTGSGLFGTVIDVDGDVITLESPSGGQTDWLRAAISKLATPPFAPVEEDGEGEYEGEYEDDGEYDGDGDGDYEQADTAEERTDVEPQGDATEQPTSDEDGSVRRL